jgi:hypothetical protein
MRHVLDPGAAFGLVREGPVDNKILLLCLLMAIIVALAELPARRRKASPTPHPQR